MSPKPALRPPQLSHSHRPAWRVCLVWVCVYLFDSVWLDWSVWLCARWWTRAWVSKRHILFGLQWDDFMSRICKHVCSCAHACVWFCWVGGRGQRKGGRVHAGRHLTPLNQFKGVRGIWVFIRWGETSQLLIAFTCSMNKLLLYTQQEQPPVTHSSTENMLYGLELLHTLQDTSFFWVYHTWVYHTLISFLPQKFCSYTHNEPCH